MLLFTNFKSKLRNLKLQFIKKNFMSPKNKRFSERIYQINVGKSKKKIYIINILDQVR